MNIQKQITQLKRAKTAKKNYQSMIKKTKESIEQKEQSQIGLSIPEITEKIIMNKILPEIQNFYENYIAYQKEENPDKTDKEIMDLTFEGIYKDTDKIKQNLEKVRTEKWISKTDNSIVINYHYTVETPTKHKDFVELPIISCRYDEKGTLEVKSPLLVLDDNKTNLWFDKITDKDINTNDGHIILSLTEQLMFCACTIEKYSQYMTNKLVNQIKKDIKSLYAESNGFRRELDAIIKDANSKLVENAEIER